MPEDNLETEIVKKVAEVTLRGLTKNSKRLFRTPFTDVTVVPLGLVFEYVNRPSSVDGIFKQRLEEVTKNIPEIVVGIILGTYQFVKESLKIKGLKEWLKSSSNETTTIVKAISQLADLSTARTLETNSGFSGFVSIRKQIRVEIFQRPKEVEIRFTVKNQLYSLLSEKEEVRNPDDNANSIKHHNAHSIFYNRKKD